MFQVTSRQFAGGRGSSNNFRQGPQGAVGSGRRCGVSRGVYGENYATSHHATSFGCTYVCLFESTDFFFTPPLLGFTFATCVPVRADGDRTELFGLGTSSISPDADTRDDAPGAKFVGPIATAQRAKLYFGDGPRAI